MLWGQPWTDDGVLASPMGFLSLWIGAAAGWPLWGMAVAFSVECIFLLFAGMFLADLISGIVHLTLDYEVGSNDDLRCHAEHSVPDVLKFEQNDELFKNAKPRDQFLWNFHSHHDAPYPASDSNLELIRQIAAPTSPVWLAMILLSIFGLVPIWLSVIIYIGLLLGLFTQFTHFLSHARGRNLVTSRLLMFCQDHRILLHPADHKSHHVHFDRDFCILNGWANCVVTPMRKAGSAVGIFPKVAPTVTTREERETRRGDVQAMEMQPTKADGL